MEHQLMLALSPKRAKRTLMYRTHQRLQKNGATCGTEGLAAMQYLTALRAAPTTPQALQLENHV